MAGELSGLFDLNPLSGSNVSELSHMSGKVCALELQACALGPHDSGGTIVAIIAIVFVSNIAVQAEGFHANIG